MNSVRVITNGRKIDGWSKASVVRSMKETSASFELTFTDVWIDTFPEILAGLACQIQLVDVDSGETTTVIDGFIDSVNIKMGAQSLQFVVSGREKTGDLIDCNRIEKPFSWNNLDLLKICQAVTAPFDIKVEVDDNADIGAKFTRASIDNGETIIQFIQKLCRQRNILPLTNTDGSLFLTVAGSNVALEKLEEGVNYTNIEGNFSLNNRFSDYLIKCQQKVKAGKDSWTGSTISIFSSAQDEFVDRYRPKLINPSTQMSTNDAKKLVEWEAQIRAGRSINFNLVIPRWTQSTGDLWKENLLASVKAPFLRLEDQFLIETVNYTVTNTELSCKLSLVDKGTYNPDPSKTIKKSSRRAGKYGWIK